MSEQKCPISEETMMKVGEVMFVVFMLLLIFGSSYLGYRWFEKRGHGAYDKKEVIFEVMKEDGKYYCLTASRDNGPENLTDCKIMLGN